MQAAAQRVIAENFLLRSMLGERGVPDAEVETYLHNTRDESENISSASVRPPTSACLPRLTPLLNTIQHPKNLGKPFLPEDPPKAHYNIQACRTVPSDSPGRSNPRLSSPVWGPSSQSPRRDVRPLSPPNEISIQPRADDALEASALAGPGTRSNFKV
jgi:hypothetical protein